MELLSSLWYIQLFDYLNGFRLAVDMIYNIE